MSTSVVRHPTAVTLTRFAWQPAAASTTAATVRPLMTPDPDDHARRQQTRDLALPSVIAQRAAGAEREGYDRGFREGEHAGRESARLRAESMLTRLSATIDQVAALRVNMLRKSEEDLVRLSVAVAERILGREIRANRAVLVTMARAAARKLGEHSVVTIQMHPDDFMAVASRGDSAPEDGPIRLIADASVLPGGCLVQSAFGTIDVSIDAQIREVLRGFLGEEFDADGGGEVSPR